MLGILWFIFPLFGGPYNTKKYKYLPKDKKKLNKTKSGGGSELYVMTNVSKETTPKSEKKEKREKKKEEEEERPH